VKLHILDFEAPYISQDELYNLYTPTQTEIELANKATKNDIPKLCFLIMLKVFQRLGYFIYTKNVPEVITEHISKVLKIYYQKEDLINYNKSGTRRRHLNIIRNHLKVVYDNKKIRHLIVKTAFEASKTKDYDADIINVVIEELVRQRCELPAFSTLVRITRKIRYRIYSSFYKYVFENLDKKTIVAIDMLFKIDENTGFTEWNGLKSDIGRPTITNLKNIIEYFNKISNIGIEAAILKTIPDSKLKHFVEEAKTLDAAKMKELEPYKRYTIAVAFLKQQSSNILDDMGEIFIKLVRNSINSAKNKLNYHKSKHSKITDELIFTLDKVAKIVKKDCLSKETRFNEINNIFNSNGQSTDEIIEKCEHHSIYAGDNYFPFLWDSVKWNRATFFKLLKLLELKSTNKDKSIEDAIQFILKNQNRKVNYIDLENENKLNLSWIQDNWWKLVAGYTNRNNYPLKVNRRNFEACVFYQIMWNLKSGDLCINNSDVYSDYREQLVSWDEYKDNIELYGRQVELPVNPKKFIEKLRDELNKTAGKVDKTFNKNQYLKIENGEPVLSRLKKEVAPKNLKLIESLIADNLKSVGIIDILIDTNNWINWTKHFKNVSGLDSKMTNLIERGIVTTFCYGCNFGPAQIAKSFEGFKRKHISQFNKRYATEENISSMIKDIVNKFRNFKMLEFWGNGKRAAADATMWDMYEQNLLSEYHIRYGGFGALGYYIVSDLYIALFSHFIPCGVWEGVYILDETIKESLDINPEILHADTQGQSTAIFGLSYLLGIQLMPRIRNWKHLKFLKSDKNIIYKHIEELFSDKVNWRLIEKHLPDMLRVALSIKMGKITPSTILRKLGTYSRKNKLYQAFRELGMVIRTIFLLNYVSDIDLRRIIQGAQNKNESFNEFVQWLSFGNDIIAENNREEQRKIIKYNHLVANAVIFYNVFHMSIILQDLAAKGYTITDRIIECMSPYIRDHIIRFGKFDFNKNRETPELNFDFTFD
jgi:TnpA family transposase